MAWWKGWFGGPSAQDRYVDVWLKGIDYGFASATGIRVTVEDALCVPGIAACIQVQSEDIAKVPLELKRRTDSGYEPATDHRLYGLLKYGPAPWLPPYKWRKALAHTVLSRGNHFSRVHRSESGLIDRITPIQPGRTITRWADDGEPFFDVTQSTGIERGLTWQDVVHIAYRDSHDGAINGGVLGVSPIMQNKETVALMIAAEQFAARFFGNGARPAIALEYDKEMPDDAVAARIRASVEGVYKGLSNAFKVMLLERGIKLKELSSNPQDSQLIETRKHGAEQACTMYRTPPHKIGLLERSTNNNIEHQSIDYVTGPLSALAKSIESAISITCLTPQEREVYKVEHNLEGLMRGDLLSRYRAYAIGRQWGWLSVNKILNRENENEIGPEGDEYLVPLNMVPAGEDPMKDDPPTKTGAEGTSEWMPSDVRYSVPHLASFNPNKLNGHSKRPTRRLATLVGAKGEPLYFN